MDATARAQGSHAVHNSERSQPSFHTLPTVTSLPSQTPHHAGTRVLSSPPFTPGGKAKKGDKGGAGVGDKARASALAHKDYDPLSAAAIEGAKWEPGKPVPFLYLARTFEAISETTKRLEIQTLLCNCFRTVIATTPDDLLPAVYLASSAVRARRDCLVGRFRPPAGAAAALCCRCCCACAA